MISVIFKKIFESPGNRFKKPTIQYIIIAIAVVIKLVQQLVATSNSGYHCDELLHIEAGKHLAFGYLDFPPMIGSIAWVQNLFKSDSLYINHIFNYLNSVLIFILCGLTTMKIGGKSLAISLTMLCVLFSPGFAASQYLFLPTAFEQLFWIAFIYFVLSFSRTENYKFIFYAAIVAAIGFLTKYSILFILAGFVLSVLIFQFKIIKEKITWISIIAFLLLIMPNVIWQIISDFPVFHHFSELYKTQLDKQSAFKELSALIMFLNPLIFFVWAAALVMLPFKQDFKSFRLPLFTLLFSFIFLLLAKGKSYYFFPVILGLLPFGSVYYERIFQRRRWLLSLFLSLISMVGLVLLPLGIPLLSLDSYIRTYKIKPNIDNKIPMAFENYYSKENWEKIIKSVDEIYSNLPVEERVRCYIWGRHYSMAGGINLLGSKFNLPPAFSFHSSFYTWVPEFSNNIVVIALSESNWKKEQWERYFTDVTEMDVIENRFASEPNWYNYRVFLCKKAKFNSAGLKELFKNEIF